MEVIPISCNLIVVLLFKMKMMVVVPLLRGGRDRNNVTDIAIGSGQSGTATNKIIGAGDVTSSNGSELNLNELHK